ncbi:MAG: DUF1641 domain-containing protein [Candidatus Thermoplasmatota archaeon]|jgi:uncharacterized protein YjgD (DUF1641 family)|nr:DUF1641 domain-containing protein [Candidatus Thermoplasmatota archaeon]MCL5793768.1 DUF1641 domain-containing protein [Candidatus Thermoplasmatota archaeon]
MKDENHDEMESALLELVKNADVIAALVPVLVRLKEAGILNLVADITKDYLPTDIEFLGHFFTSREFTYAALKSANLLSSVMYALSDEKISDSVKLLMFNARGIADRIDEVQDRDSPLTPLELYRMMRDKNTARGFRAVMAALNALGEILSKGSKS